MNSKLNKNNKNTKGFLLCLLIFALVGFIAYSAPATMDDWAWGSSEGVARLALKFKDYNGRYLGNLLVLLLSRSDILFAIIAAIGALSICLLAKNYIGTKRTSVMALIFFLFMCMPNILFVQIVPWASGFSNYFPPTLLLVCYMAVTKNIFTKKVPTYSVFISFLCFFIGGCGALFMENITLFSVCLGVAVIIYTFVKFKKAYLCHILYLMGTIVGSVIMFSNSAYGFIAGGQDKSNYRTMATSAPIGTLLSQTYPRVTKYFMQNNVVLIGFLFGALTLLCYFGCKEKSINGKAKTASKIFAGYQGIYFCYVIFMSINESQKIANEQNLMPLSLALAILFYISLVAQTFCIFGKGEKTIKILTPLFYAGGLVVPLFLVKPIDARCFFAPYFMQCIFAGFIFTKLLTYLKTKSAAKIAGILMAVALITVTAYYGVIFNSVAQFDKERTSYMYQQVSESKNEIVVASYPPKLSQHLYCSQHLGSNTWQRRFKDYYHIDQNKTIVSVSYETYKTITKK